MSSQKYPRKVEYAIPSSPNLFYLYSWSLKSKKKDEIYVSGKKNTKKNKKKVFPLFLLQKFTRKCVKRRTNTKIIKKEYRNLFRRSSKSLL